MALGFCFLKHSVEKGQFDGESSLRECVCKAYPAALWDIVDYNLLEDGSESSDQQSGEHTSMHQCLSSLLLNWVCYVQVTKQKKEFHD